MKITEQNVVQQLKKKNEKALEFVISEYGWMIKTITKKQLRQLPNMQEECMDDVLLAVWDNIDSYDKERSTLKNWIAGISRYKAIDCKRKQLRYVKEESLEFADEIEDLISTDILEQEISEEVDEILSFLNENDQLLFKRLFVNDESIEFVATSMGVEKSVLYNRVSRGKKKIQKRYLTYRREQAE